MTHHMAPLSMTLNDLGGHFIYFKHLLIPSASR